MIIITTIITSVVVVDGTGLQVLTAPMRSSTPLVRDKNLYTTTNTCLQCLIKMMYTVL